MLSASGTISLSSSRLMVQGGPVKTVAGPEHTTSLSLPYRYGIIRPLTRLGFLVMSILMYGWEGGQVQRSR
jgi:hypothetical protein